MATQARRERWVLTTAELLAAGVSEAWISRRAQDGWLTRQFRGVWLVGRDRATRDELERAAVADEDALMRAVHEADHLKRLSVRHVDAALARAGARPRGAPTLRRCLHRYRPTTGTVNRSLERDFVHFLRQHGFPPTEHNALVELGAGDRVALDVFFGPYGVAVELDGGAHETKERFHADRRRDRRVQAAQGIVTLRVTGEDLREHDAELAEDLWATLERRGLLRHETPRR